MAKGVLTGQESNNSLPRRRHLYVTVWIDLYPILHIPTKTWPKITKLDAVEILVLPMGPAVGDT